MASVKKFLYNAIDDDNMIDCLLSYLYKISHGDYPDTILVLTGDSGTIHQFLNLVGGVHYNGCLQSLIPEAHHQDTVDKLSGLIADDFEVCLTDYNIDTSPDKVSFFDYREENNINFELFKTASAVIVWARHVVIKNYDVSTYQRLCVINFTNVDNEFKLIHKTRDSFLKHTLELKELCEGAKERKYVPLSNDRYLVYPEMKDQYLLDLLVERLRPRNNKLFGDHFGIYVPNNPTSMARLLIDGTPLLVQPFYRLPEKYVPDNPTSMARRLIDDKPLSVQPFHRSQALYEEIDPMEVKHTKIKNINYMFNGWLDHEIYTENMFDDVKWKSQTTIDINIDDLLDLVELFDGFILCYHTSDEGDFYVISPTEFNLSTVKKTYELFARLRLEGRLTHSKVDLFT
jgi:hypothetical protein